MNLIISWLLGWILPFVLVLACIPSHLLNRKSHLVARASSILLWTTVVLSVVATGLLFASPERVVSEGLFCQGLFGVRLDALSLSLLLLISFLGAVIMKFAKNYLAGDERQGHFSKWMVCTLGAVMILTLAPGLVQFLAGWLATSLGLHKLLIYFPDRKGTLLSARKKAVVSRVGDVLLITAFIGIYQSFGTQNFSELFEAIKKGQTLEGYGWVAWLLSAGALLKSAQFPFHSWLPETMGAPTPVSALMHAGIINGGGYLIIRMSPLMVSEVGALMLLAVVGTITAFYGAMVMLTQTSVKKALAYSTIAQMGFMMLQCGLGAFHLAALHILAHSLYKAYTFLSSGSAVSIAQQLYASPKSLVLPPRHIWKAVFPSFLIVVGVACAFGVTPQNKPGMLVLSLVVVMALTHWLWVQMKRGVAGKDWLKSLVTAAFYAVIYFALAKAAIFVWADTFPKVRALPLELELLLAALISVFLLTSIRFQDGHPGFLQVRLKRALYVHSLNGFYLNTMVNKLAKAIGLVPKGL